MKRYVDITSSRTGPPLANEPLLKEEYEIALTTAQESAEGEQMCELEYENSNSKVEEVHQTGEEVNKKEKNPQVEAEAIPTG
ncbi:unnamed protein product, partial [Dibothriocephalus latus]